MLHVNSIVRSNLYVKDIFFSHQIYRFSFNIRNSLAINLLLIVYFYTDINYKQTEVLPILSISVVGLLLIPSKDQEMALSMTSIWLVGRCVGRLNEFR